MSSRVATRCLNPCETFSTMLMFRGNQKMQKAHTGFSQTELILLFIKKFAKAEESVKANFPSLQKSLQIFSWVSSSGRSSWKEEDPTFSRFGFQNPLTWSKFMICSFGLHCGKRSLSEFKNVQREPRGWPCLCVGRLRWGQPSVGPPGKETAAQN